MSIKEAIRVMEIIEKSYTREPAETAIHMAIGALRAQQVGVDRNPCVNCGDGWGEANANGVTTCTETCEKLAAYMDRQRYKNAIQRMGEFGELFLTYRGDPRGPSLGSSTEPLDNEVLRMPVIEDVEGVEWIPVNAKILNKLVSQYRALRDRQVEQNEALTLDELRKMDGEPVWVEDISYGGHGGWEICYGEGASGAALWFADDVFSAENYGKTWLAYRRKPMEGTIYSKFHKL